MKRMTRSELFKLEEELETLLNQVKEINSKDDPDLVAVSWIEHRVNTIKSMINKEDRKVQFVERGLSLLS